MNNGIKILKCFLNKRQKECMQIRSVIRRLSEINESN